MKLINSLYSKVEKYFKSLVTLDLPAYKISQSFALGIFIGLTIPMGFQTIIIFPIVIMLKCNFPIAWGATTISNPVTIIPIYLAAAYLGERITGIKISLTKFQYVLHNPTSGNFWNLGYNTLVVLLTGTLIIGLVLAAVAYYLSFFLITKYKDKNRT